MAPVYKPLATAGGIQGAPGLPAEIFAAPADFDWDAAQKEKAAMLAQEILNQKNQLALDQQQEEADRQAQIRRDIQSQFSGDSDADLENALGLIQESALKSGDFETAINAEKARKTRKSETAPADPLLVQHYERLLGVTLPPGITESQLNKLIYAESVAGSGADARTRVTNMRAEGTLPVTVSNVELGKLENADSARQSIAEVNSLLPQLDPGALSALKAGKVTDYYKDPGSPAYRMYARLELLKKQVARMNDSGALTQLDVDMFAPFTVGSPIYDDRASLAQRMQDLDKYISNKQQSIIKRNEQGYRNMDRFKAEQANPDDLANSLTQDQAAQDQQYKEQIKQRRLAELRAGAK